MYRRLEDEMGEVATTFGVIRQLKGNYNVDDETAKKLVEKHKGLIGAAKRLGSFSYYPAQQIAEVEKLEYHGRLDDEEEKSEKENS